MLKELFLNDVLFDLFIKLPLVIAFVILFYKLFNPIFREWTNADYYDEQADRYYDGEIEADPFFQ